MSNHGSGKPKSSDVDKDEQNSKLTQIVSSKLNKIKNNLIADIKLLTQLEVEKFEEFKKAEFSSTVLKLPGDELELYCRRGSIRTEIILLSPTKQQMTYMKESGDLLNVAGQDVSVSCIDNDYYLELKIKIMEKQKEML